ncbi:MAG: hypothetical protein IPP77_05305 [Bacteroidetes bacterium]|nr:hypothetical protein [Bacteroidota bacterium]
MIVKVILTIFYLLLFNLLIHKYRKFQFSIFKPWITHLVFNLKFVVGIFIWMIYTFYYTDVQQNDIHKFYDDAAELHFIKTESPATFWRLMTGVSMKPEDAGKLSQLKNWNRNFDEAPINENRTIIRLNAWLLFLSFKTYPVHILFMCFISLVGLILLTDSIFQFVEPKASILSLFVLFTPSVLFWTSGVMKEPLLMLGLGLFVSGAIHLRFQAWKFRHVIGWLLGSVLILFTKFFVLACLVPSTLAFFLFKKNESGRFVFLKYAGISGLLLIAALNIQHLVPGVNLQKMLLNKQAHSIKEAEYHHAGSRIEIPELTSSPISLIKAAPVALWNTIVRPWVWESKNVMMLASAVENMLMLLFLILCISSTDWGARKNLDLFLFLLFSALAYFVLIGIATPVIGNLVRYKAPLLPLFMFAFILRVRSNMIADNLKFVLR